MDWGALAPYLETLSNQSTLHSSSLLLLALLPQRERVVVFGSRQMRINSRKILLETVLASASSPRLPPRSSRCSESKNTKRAAKVDEAGARDSVPNAREVVLAVRNAGPKELHLNVGMDIVEHKQPLVVVCAKM